MKPGSVIVDLAAETGGNCELTRPGETIDSNGVTIAGPLNLASMGALHASEMYARNVFNFVSLLLQGRRAGVRLERRVAGEDGMAGAGRARRVAGRRAHLTRRHSSAGWNPA